MLNFTLTKIKLTAYGYIRIQHHMMYVKSVWMKGRFATDDPDYEYA